MKKKLIVELGPEDFTGTVESLIQELQELPPKSRINLIDEQDGDEMYFEIFEVSDD